MRSIQLPTLDHQISRADGIAVDWLESVLEILMEEALFP